MDAATIVRRVRAAGVVGAGGAGFPTHVKLQSQVEWLIANGAECEPLLYADQALMEARTAEIIRGLDLVRSATGARRVVIALKAKYRAARTALEEAAGQAGIDLFLLDDFYPAGDEQVLVHLITGRIVPPGGIPLQVATLVQNVETLCNIARAVDHGEPVTTKYLTVSGAVQQPISVRVPIGTPVQELVRLAGGAAVDDPVLLVGGVLMGHLAEPGEPVTKRTGGVILLPRSLPWVQRLIQPWTINKKQSMNCIQCHFCTELCPRFLLGHAILPNRLMLQAGYGLQVPEVEIGALLCCECGLCEAFACPELLMPRQAAIQTKRRLAEQGVRYTPGATPERGAHPLLSERRVPSIRVKERLGIDGYDRKAPLVDPELVVPTVSLLLTQHVGAPALPLVEVGEAVAIGQLVAEPPEGRLGAALHASISGRVIEVSPDAIVIAAPEQGGE